MNLLSFPSCASLCAFKTSSAFRKVQVQISTRISDITYIFYAFISDPCLMIGNTLNYNVFDSCQLPLSYLFSTPYCVKWTTVIAVKWARKSHNIYFSRSIIFCYSTVEIKNCWWKNYLRVTNLNEGVINFPFKCFTKIFLKRLQFSGEYAEKIYNQSPSHIYQ
jgi:hypothetical protein